MVVASALFPRIEVNHQDTMGLAISHKRSDADASRGSGTTTEGRRPEGLVNGDNKKVFVFCALKSALPRCGDDGGVGLSMEPYSNTTRSPHRIFRGLGVEINTPLIAPRVPSPLPSFPKGRLHDCQNKSWSLQIIRINPSGVAAQDCLDVDRG